MIARVQPKPPGCEEIHWRELLLAMNSRPARVLVRRESLGDVVNCHVDRLGLKSPADLQVMGSGLKYVSVDRMALFAFVQEHGDACAASRRKV